MQVMSSLSERSTLHVSSWFTGWLRERIVTGVWWLIPLSLVISFAGGWQQWLFRAIIAMCALVSFRLWDDLEDVQHDRLWHPKRILCLCKPALLSRVYGFGAAALATSVFFVVVAGGRWIAIVAALIVVIIASRLRTRMTDSALRLVFAHIILVKYPALVVSLAQADMAPNVLWGRALGLAGFVGAYEVVHDMNARRSSWAPFIFVIDIVCFLLGLANWITKET
jgi:hypothetical protein